MNENSIFTESVCSKYTELDNKLDINSKSVFI